ncbi:unnamed protein product [Clavelina lepadiformis]|uniref:Uncharacterized protein n=1 Tax=Clavelina lepadiformis TaxID=159417 RepID=A0ABP0FMP4_CLALP
MKLFVLVTVFFLVHPSSPSDVLDCPFCSSTCREAGFMSCDTCLCAPSCDLITCSPPRECVLRSEDCVSEPCPKLPTCIDFSRVCNSVLRDHDSVILCDMNEVRCPPDFMCKNVTGQDIAVCCSKDPKLGDMFLSSSDKPIPGDSTDCDSCPIEPCKLAQCPKNPTAQCVTDDCSCTSWFIDHDLNEVDCFGENTQTIPDFLLPGIDGEVPIPPIDVDEGGGSDDVDFPFPPNLPLPPTSAYSPPGDSLDVGPTLKPKPPPAQPSGVTDNPPDEANDVILHVVIASCVVFVFIILLLLACKVASHRKKSLHRTSYEEQLKPLKVDVEKNGNNN